MQLASENFMRVLEVMLVSLGIVVLIFLIIHYQEKIVKFFCRKKKIHPQITEQTYNMVIIQEKIPENVTENVDT